MKTQAGGQRLAAGDAVSAVAVIVREDQIALIGGERGEATFQMRRERAIGRQRTHVMDVGELGELHPRARGPRRLLAQQQPGDAVEIVFQALDRFAIGDRDALVFDDDGSLDLLVQHERPAGRESNWLPAPATGTLGITMRLYAPRREVLDGRWNPPPLRRVG